MARIKKTYEVARRIEALLLKAQALAAPEDISSLSTPIDNALRSVREYANPNTATSCYCEGCGRVIFSWYDHKDNCPKHRKKMLRTLEEYTRKYKN